MEELTEWALEKELEQHTREQRESLMAIDEAIASDSANEELLLMKEELMISVKAAEHSLLQLKRARLLQEVDAMAQVCDITMSSSHRVEGQAHERPSRPGPDEREAAQEQTFSFAVGSRCRFRHTNGRWYNGKILRLEGPDVARVSFLTPTTEQMQICRFHLQQRCRFGGYCRQSHGVEVPLDALQVFFAPLWQNIPVGTVVLACDTDDEDSGIWRQAELESLDETDQKAGVVFIADGSRANVRYENLALSEYAELTDTSETSSESEEGRDDDVTDSPGMGLLSTGQQTDTVTFAKWEKHTRGVASKMMANMGFREGMGLGKSGQGQLAPIEVRVLPPKQSLGYVDGKRKLNDVNEGGGVNATGSMKKKKPRGGKRKQQKRWAAAAFAVKVEEDRAVDVFDFINQQLAGQGGNETQGSTKSGVETYGSHKRGDRKSGKDDRQTILAHEDEMIEIRSKIVKLEEMAARNQKEKAVFDGVSRRLQEARKALKDAETAHAKATNAVHSKEKEKRWLRF